MQETFGVMVVLCKLFTTLMTMPHSLSKPAYNNIHNVLYETFKGTVDKSKASGAEVIKN